MISAAAPLSLIDDLEDRVLPLLRGCVRHEKPSDPEIGLWLAALPGSKNTRLPDDFDARLRDHGACNSLDQ